MGRKLTVTVIGDDGNVYVEGTSEGDIPEEAGISAAAHFADTASASEDDQDEDGPPPKSGRGSGKGAWADYAVASNVEVGENASKDEIIAALDAAGVPTE